MAPRRRLLAIVLVVLGGLLLATYAAFAQGAFLYRDADHRFAATLEPEGLSEAEQVWRFEIPAGVRAIEIHRRVANEGEAELAFGRGPGTLHRHGFITPGEWETPWPFGGRSHSRTDVAPGPYEIHVSAKAPARFLLGVYFVENASSAR